jgi:anaerobic selenocysteine-containing dehydrogenase
VPWDGDAIHKWAECPPPGRKVNMNRLGAALLGEVADPPIKSLFVFGSNPAAIAPNAGRVVEGLRREDLFTVVHELFLTDTADFADIVLPATSQLEHTDLHKAYGHTYLTYNHPAISPLGECKSNWQVMKLLAAEMGFTEPWLQQSADEVLDEVLTATAATQPQFAGITLERLKQEGTIPLTIEPEVPFADGRFPTPSGQVELYSQTMADMGLDPLPGWDEVADSGGQDGAMLNGPFGRLNRVEQLRAGRFPPKEALTLLSPASHHFTTSTFANQDGLMAREGEPFVEIHPDDAARHNIQSGDVVRLENGRSWCDLQAKVTDGVRRGVVASPKGRWSRWGDGRNVNWLTSDALGDMAGQSTFHSSRVWLRRIEE